MEKRFISSQEHFEDSFRLAMQIYESGYRPQTALRLAVTKVQAHNWAT